MHKIKPVLIDISTPFPPIRQGGEWAREYLIVLGNELNKDFKLSSLKKLPQEIGYNFFLMARSPGYNKVSDDITQASIDKALVLPTDDIKVVKAYILGKLAEIEEMDFDAMLERLDTFLDISDVEDDERLDTKGVDSKQ